MRFQPDRTAQDQRGPAAPDAAEFGETPPQLPAVDIDAVVARRVAMLLRFMRAARVLVSKEPPLRRRDTTGRKGGDGSTGRKGKQSGGAVKPRREQRAAHHQKRLKNLGRRIVVKPYDDGPPDVRLPRRPPPRPS